jgi:hypothetical protein
MYIKIYIMYIMMYIIMYILTYIDNAHYNVVAGYLSTGSNGAQGDTPLAVTRPFTRSWGKWHYAV